MLDASALAWGILRMSEPCKKLIPHAELRCTELGDCFLQSWELQPTRTRTLCQAPKSNLLSRDNKRGTRRS